MRLVLVEWDDAARHGAEWQTLAEALDEASSAMMRMRTVGFLLRDSGASVVIAQTVGAATAADPDGTVLYTFQIPRGCIVRITPLDAQQPAAAIAAA